jgi:hypothetical protein
MVPLPVLVQSLGCHELWKKVEIFPPVPLTVNISKAEVFSFSRTTIHILMILINQRQPPITLETPHVYSGAINLFVYFVLYKSPAIPLYHRVDRVLGFFSSRPHWNSPTPSPAGECVPPPFGWGGGAHSLAGEWLGESQFRRGDRHCSTLGIYVLFALYCTQIS